MNWKVPSGITQGLLTPMTADGEVDYPTLGRLTRFHIEEGKASSLAPLLHFGENTSLTVAERMRVVDCVRDAAGDVPLLVHVTTPDTASQQQLIRHAAQAGAAAVIAMPPYARGLTPGEANLHFRDLAKSADIPMILYHSPGSGHAIAVDAPATLMKEGLPIIGVKDAGNDLAFATRACELAMSVDSSFAFMPGLEFLITGRTAGVRASFGICSFIAPRLLSGFERAVANEELELAAMLQAKVVSLLSVLVRAYPGAAKAAAAIFGRPVGPPRAPNLLPDEAATRLLVEDLKALGLLDSEVHGWGDA